MRGWRQITSDAKDMLTVCLAKAIDQAMAAQIGENWFAEFAQDDAGEKVSLRITKAGQSCVQDLDLQALLKFLRYRSHFTTQVLQYHGFFQQMDAFATEDQLRQLNALLDRLINDFRNRIEAHSRAADIEKELSGQGPQRIYGYEEAYQDMCKLARIFSTVTDSKGVAYCRRMAELTRKKPPFIWLIAAVLVIGILICLVTAPKPYRNDSAPLVQPSQITVQPIEVYYEGNELVALCYVVNGTEQTVSDIDIYSMRLTDQGKELASANFGILRDSSIPPNHAIQWKFRFPKDTVLFKDRNLTDPQIIIQYQLHS